MDASLEQLAPDAPMLLLPVGLWRGFGRATDRQALAVSLSARAEAPTRTLCALLLAEAEPELAVPIFYERPETPAVALAAWVDELARRCTVPRLRLAGAEGRQG
jgi:hypothetical protein